MKRNNPPQPYDLKASFEWLRWKFGAKGQAHGALRHVNRCLDEIASYEYDFLMSKATYLGYLEHWKELENLLNYLDNRYPGDAEVLYQRAEYRFAQGRWQEALALLRKAERKLNATQSTFLECLYDTKIACLVVLGRPVQAKREARRIIDKYKKFTIIRSVLRVLEHGKYKRPKPWAKIISQQTHQPDAD